MQFAVLSLPLRSQLNNKRSNAYRLLRELPVCLLHRSLLWGNQVFKPRRLARVTLNPTCVSIQVV